MTQAPNHDQAAHVHSPIPIPLRTSQPPTNSPTHPLSHSNPATTSMKLPSARKNTIAKNAPASRGPAKSKRLSSAMDTADFGTHGRWRC